MVTQPTARHTGENATEAAFRRQVTALKDGVRIEEVVGEYGNFRPTGTSWLLGRCLSPSHEDRTPSMTIYTDRQKFRCYSCGERGDAIDLEMLVNPGMEIQEAMVSLSLRYGVPLPERSRAWFDRQTRQAPIRERIEAEKIALYLVQGIRDIPKLLSLLAEAESHPPKEVNEAILAVLNDAMALEKARAVLLGLDIPKE